MAMPWKIRRAIDLEKWEQKAEHLGILAFTGAKNAHQLILTVFENDKPVSFDGYNVRAYFLRSGEKVMIQASVTSNVVAVKFPAAAYAIQTRVSLVVRAENTEDMIPLYGAVFDLACGDKPVTIDPDDLVMDISELLAEVDDMRAATADSKAATEGALAAAQEARDTATDVQAQMDAYKVTVDGTLSSLKDQKAPAIEVEASGVIVTVDDAAAMPVHGLVSQIVPVQAGSGDPSPDNVRAISGWTKVNAVRTKKNLYGGLYLANDFASKINNSVIDAEAKTVSYTSGSITGKRLHSSFKPDTQYTAIITLTAESTGSTTNMRFRYTDGTSSDVFRHVEAADGKKQAIVISAAGKSIDYLLGVSFAGVQYLLYEESGIFEGALTADEFVPFDGENISADLPETVYGGTLDWKTGVLAVDSTMLTIDGSMVNKWGTASNGIPDVEILDDRATKECVVCCNRYKSSTVAAESAIRGWTERFWVYDSRFVDEDTAINILNDEKPQVVFKIKKPYTIQLTPQQMDMLKGYNNVWSDTGDTSLVYVADTKMYIDKKFDALAAALIG